MNDDDDYSYYHVWLNEPSCVLCQFPIEVEEDVAASMLMFAPDVRLKLRITTSTRTSGKGGAGMLHKAIQIPSSRAQVAVC
jgi:hypothetical protein